MTNNISQEASNNYKIVMYNLTWGSGLGIWEVIELSARCDFQKWDKEYAWL